MGKTVFVLPQGTSQETMHLFMQKLKEEENRFVVVTGDIQVYEVDPETLELIEKEELGKSKYTLDSMKLG